MRRTEIDQHIEALAARQHEVFSRQQAFDLGASERFVARRLADKWWIRQVPAVYALATSPGTWLRQCKVAELSVSGSAIAGSAALALHGITGFKPGPLELLVPINAPCRHPTAVVHRYSGASLTTVQGIRATTVAQSLFDTAIVCSPRKLERGMDDGLLSKKVSVAGLAERLEFYEGSRRPGLPKIRPLILERLEDGWVPPESELEAKLFEVLATMAGLRVVRQAPLPWRASAPGRVDALLPDDRLIIEADGRRWHTRMEDFDRDQQRNNEATAHGWRTLRFTWVHLNHFPDYVTDVVTRTVHPSSAA
jgi:very-short-patch-repair endonuclease